MTRIVFVYAGSPDDGYIQSPYSITRNVWNFLRTTGLDLRYYEWSSTEEVELRPDDIVLAHPNYPENTPCQRLFRAGPCRAKCLIHPLHTAKVEDNWPFDQLARQADHIFSITGPYWYDTLDQTCFAHWKPKITRLDMAVDSNYWAYQKHNFNRVGSRGLVYIGSSIPNKNLGFLTEIACALPTVRFQWYGGSSDHPLARLPNVYIEGWQELNQTKVAEICAANDFFISTSFSDANPTTAVEFGLASGLIPICTKESGYLSDEFINIPLNNVAGAVHVIKDWLEKPDAQLKERSLANRVSCEHNYSWDVFCNKIWEQLKRFL